MRSLLVLCTVLAVLAGTTTSVDAQEANPPFETLDLEFKGGTALDYLDAVRREAGRLNVIAKPEVGMVKIEPVELRQVDLSSAIYMLNGMIEETGDRAVELEVDIVRHGPGEPIYIVRAEVASISRPRRVHSAVWSVQEILDGGLGAEDLLTAVQTSIDLFGESSTKTEIRFHEETGLLIARGPVEEIESIESVIVALAKSPAKGREEALNQLREEAVAEINALRQRLEDSEHEAQMLSRRVAEAESRHEFTRSELDQIKSEATGALASRNRMIEELESEVRMLRRQLQEEGGK